MESVTVLENLTEFRTISDFLGSKELRYMSEGFKKVIRSFGRIEIDRATETISAEATFSYEDNWSKKDEQLRTDVHLSTFDIAIVASKVCELFLVEIEKLSAFEIERAWIRSIQMKLGSSPCVDLNNIPVRCTRKESYEESDSLNGMISSFTFRLGTISADMTVDHPVVRARSNPYEKTTPISIFTPSVCCFGSDYSKKDVDIVNLRYNAKELSVNAEAVLVFDSDYEPPISIGRAYPTSINLLDLMMLGGQLGAFLIYQNDQISREESNTLWMRKFDALLERPYYSMGNYSVHMKILASRHICRSGQHWSITDPMLQLDSHTNGYIRGEFVHLLPTTEEK